jgi:hypothetical protein
MNEDTQDIVTKAMLIIEAAFEQAIGLKVGAGRTATEVKRD